MVNNYYKTGPAKATTKVTTVSIANSTSASDDKWCWNMTSRYYIAGNQVNSTANYDWTNISYDEGVVNYQGQRYTKDPNHYYGEEQNYTKINNVDCLPIKLEKPVAPTGEITTHSALNAYNKVLTYAGASLYQDVVDARYFSEALNGTATYRGSVTSYVKDGKTYERTIPYEGRIDIVSDCNGYTEDNFGTASRPEGFDTDQDGIPDEWETANGLNPNDKSDAANITIDSKGWYTNLEVYANSLVEDIMKAGNADADSNFEEYYPVYNKPTAINISRTSAIYATEYYSLDGRKLAEPQRGINIRVEHLSNGQKVTTKVVR